MKEDRGHAGNQPRRHVNRRRELFNEHRPWTLGDEAGILRKAGLPASGTG